MSEYFTFVTSSDISDSFDTTTTNATSTSVSVNLVPYATTTATTITTNATTTITTTPNTAILTPQTMFPITRYIMPNFTLTIKFKEEIPTKFPAVFMARNIKNNVKNWFNYRVETEEDFKDWKKRHRYWEIEIIDDTDTKKKEWKKKKKGGRK